MSPLSGKAIDSYMQYGYRKFGVQRPATSAFLSERVQAQYGAQANRY